MGRPTKLTDEICEAIADSIKEGIPPGTAAELHGITKRTHERWLKRGREAKRKTKYTEYCRRIEGAKAYASKTHLHAIMESKDWKARKYLLTLLDTTYALPDKLELSGQVDSDVHAVVKEEGPDIDVESLSPELRAELTKVLSKIEAEREVESG